MCVEILDGSFLFLRLSIFEKILSNVLDGRCVLLVEMLHEMPRWYSMAYAEQASTSLMLALLVDRLPERVSLVRLYWQ